MVSRIPEDDIRGVATVIGATGTVVHSKRLLGDDGADNVTNNGAGASLNTTGGVTTLTAAAPSFSADDVGRLVLVSGAADAGANGMREITEFVDTSNVKFASEAADGADGNNGAISWTVVATGGWFRQNGLWKTFMLYSLDRKTALGALVDVRIDGCMELADVPENSVYVELATLDQTTPNFSLEAPWRYVRARVFESSGGTVQVGLQEQGQGGQ
jgi:hypothetical protein